MQIKSIKHFHYLIDEKITQHKKYKKNHKIIANNNDQFFILK